MLSKLLLFTLPLLGAFAAAVENTSPKSNMLDARQPDSDSGCVPTLVPFLTVELVVWRPVNASTPTGIVASAANCRGGFVRGAFDADILPVGAAFEEVYVNEEGEHSFYQNRYHMINAKNESIILEVKAVLEYVNQTLHGFGWGTFRTTAKGLGHINYRPYVFEVASNFNTGHAQGSLFELTSYAAGGKDPSKCKRAVVETRQDIGGGEGVCRTCSP